jgi:hypothetical protein
MKLKIKNNGIQTLREKRSQQLNRLKKMKKIALAHNLKITLKSSLNSSHLMMRMIIIVIAVMMNMTAQAILRSLRQKVENLNSNYIIRS